MFTVAKMPLSYLVLTFLTIALLSAPSLQAKKQKEVFPAAPLPVQIAVAKKVFVSNGGFERYNWLGEEDRLYNQFYAAMKDWGRYELVSAPADADLILDIRAISVESTTHERLRLVILDPKTHVALWTFNEFIDYLDDKQFDEAMDKIMADMKQLVEPVSSASTKPKPSSRSRAT